MTATVELLARCRALGVELGVNSGGTSLLWEAAADPPADLLAELAANKADVLALIRGPVRELRPVRARPRRQAPLLALL